MSEKCSKDQEKGTCSSCKAGTYAEHPTGMEQCLQCSHCHIGKALQNQLFIPAIACEKDSS